MISTHGSDSVFSTHTHKHKATYNSNIITNYFQLTGKHHQNIEKLILSLYRSDSLLQRMIKINQKAVTETLTPYEKMLRTWTKTEVQKPKVQVMNSHVASIPQISHARWYPSRETTIREAPVQKWSSKAQPCPQDWFRILELINYSCPDTLDILI